ncbi:ATP-binding protein [Shewanella glacialimarina]|uniref:ATP-binding protein n=1 Tax=Shewanella glacialimarina TaxID=2590884 RepID=UPI001CF8385E|nr:ATP-binding protein [Shewanella glacialimarina]UCX06265.1 sensor histidine kinase [Shewanella glacialimarina]
MSNITTTSFRANAHLLKLLGDQLIGDDRLAVFELVKNAYDADATSVEVELNLNNEQPYIAIWDHDGHGMNKNTILTKWMEIGTESKRNSNWIRSSKFGRLPLGEKGVGRLAVHKLGSIMQLNTRSKGFPEVQITIDWPKVIGQATYIEDTKVQVEELATPLYFPDEMTGTRIVVSNLNKLEWTRGDIRRLKRLLTSLTSPFKTTSDFEVFLTVPGREVDYDDVLDAEDVINNALWKYEFEINTNGEFSYHYTFNPPSLYSSLKSETKAGNNEALELFPPSKEERLSRFFENRNDLLLTPNDLTNIGPIKGCFYVFSREKEILNALGAYQSIRQYLDDNTGIRVYRDGIRVFNYGERNDDWLGLNAMRVNNPGKRIAVNLVIGNVELNLENSRGLEEKTNREGFDENEDFIRFRLITFSIMEHFHLLHLKARQQLQDAKQGANKKEKLPTQRFEENIQKLKDGLVKHKLDKELGGQLSKIESDYKQMRQVTLSAVTGVNLSVIFHEVERGIIQLNSDIQKNVDYNTLRERSGHLAKLLEGFAPLLKNNASKKFPARALIEGALDFSQHRFSHHGVIASCPLKTDEAVDFEIKGPSNLLLAAINNIIDNAIHWTGLKAEKGNDADYKPGIQITTLTDFFKEGPAIVVLDNGPGFDLTPDEAIQPFNTTRPGGMGVGLYYADQVMESIGGKIIITTAEDLDLSEVYSGAAVALVFNKVN